MENTIETITNLIKSSEGQPLAGDELKALYDNNHTIWRNFDMAQLCQYEDLLQSDISDGLRSQMTFARAFAFNFQMRGAGEFINKFMDNVTPESQPEFFEHPSKSFFMIPVHPDTDSPVRESQILKSHELAYKMLYNGSADLTSQDMVALVATCHVLGDEYAEKLTDMIIERCNTKEETLQALTGMISFLYNNENHHPRLGDGCIVLSEKMVNHYMAKGGDMTDPVTVDGNDYELGGVLIRGIIMGGPAETAHNIQGLINAGVDIPLDEGELQQVLTVSPEIGTAIEHAVMLRLATAQNASIPQNPNSAKVEPGAEFKMAICILGLEINYCRI